MKQAKNVLNNEKGLAAILMAMITAGIISVAASLIASDVRRVVNSENTVRKAVEAYQIVDQLAQTLMTAVVNGAFATANAIACSDPPLNMTDVFNHAIVDGGGQRLCIPTATDGNADADLCIQGENGNFFCVDIGTISVKNEHLKGLTKEEQLALMKNEIIDIPVQMRMPYKNKLKYWANYRVKQLSKKLANIMMNMAPSAVAANPNVGVPPVISNNGITNVVTLTNFANVGACATAYNVDPVGTFACVPCTDGGVGGAAAANQCIRLRICPSDADCVANPEQYYFQRLVYVGVPF